MDYTEKLTELLQLEEELQFSYFTNELALEIGNRIIEIAKQNNYSITIDICRNGHQLFHYAFAGTRMDNDEWVKRKNRVVNRFSHSSYYMEIFLESIGKTITEKYHVDQAEYAASGGSFPIIIKNVGVVGTITASGLKSSEDHELVTSVIREFV